MPLQRYAHRSDLPCGSTIGPITAAAMGIATVDVGAPQLAMHSARELCGADDPPRYAAAMAAFLAPGRLTVDVAGRARRARPRPDADLDRGARRLPRPDRGRATPTAPAATRRAPRSSPRPTPPSSAPTARAASPTAAPPPPPPPPPPRRRPPAGAARRAARGARRRHRPPGRARPTRRSPGCVEACHRIGDVTYIDRSCAILEALVPVEGEGVCSLVITLQGRADGTDAFCTLEAIEHVASPPVRPVVERLVHALRHPVTLIATADWRP